MTLKKPKTHRVRGFLKGLPLFAHPHMNYCLEKERAWGGTYETQKIMSEHYRNQQLQQQQASQCQTQTSSKRGSHSSGGSLFGQHLAQQREQAAALQSGRSQTAQHTRNAKASMRESPSTNAN
jgi:hypothetical protein